MACSFSTLCCHCHIGIQRPDLEAAQHCCSCKLLMEAAPGACTCSTLCCRYSASRTGPPPSGGPSRRDQLVCSSKDLCAWAVKPHSAIQTGWPTLIWSGVAWCAVPSRLQRGACQYVRQYAWICMRRAARSHAVCAFTSLYLSIGAHKHDPCSAWTGICGLRGALRAFLHTSARADVGSCAWDALGELRAENAMSGGFRCGRVAPRPPHLGVGRQAWPPTLQDHMAACKGSM
jgi:hypothetical protein